MLLVEKYIYGFQCVCYTTCSIVTDNSNLLCWTLGLYVSNPWFVLDFPDGVLQKVWPFIYIDMNVGYWEQIWKINLKIKLF